VPFSLYSENYLDVITFTPSQSSYGRVPSCQCSGPDSHWQRVNRIGFDHFFKRLEWPVPLHVAIQLDIIIGVTHRIIERAASLVQQPSNPNHVVFSGADRCAKQFNRFVKVFIRIGVGGNVDLTLMKDRAGEAFVVHHLILIQTKSPLP
jgi:hypothetical protein